MSTYTERARALRPYIVKSAASLTDADASLAPELFNRLTGSGSLVKAGMRINWGGTIKRAASDLWDTAQNTPDAAPDLWEDIAYKKGFRLIPETITAFKLLPFNFSFNANFLFATYSLIFCINYLYKLIEFI